MQLSCGGDSSAARYVANPKAYTELIGGPHFAHHFKFLHLHDSGEAREMRRPQTRPPERCTVHVPCNSNGLDVVLGQGNFRRVETWAVESSISVRHSQCLLVFPVGRSSRPASRRDRVRSRRLLSTENEKRNSLNTNQAEAIAFSALPRPEQATSNL